MLKNILRVVVVAFLLVFLGYLALPNPDFPKPPPDALQSKEPADTETPLRRAYFTNYTRQEVLDWYKAQLSKSAGIPMPTYLLNYPPEEAQTIIRDQTRTTFLQEVVHPLRESVYVNGYEPRASDGKNAINIEGRHWRQKIIVKYVPSPVFIRLIVFAGIVFFSVILFMSWRKIKI